MDWQKLTKFELMILTTVRAVALVQPGSRFDASTFEIGQALFCYIGSTRSRLARLRYRLRKLERVGLVARQQRGRESRWWPTYQGSDVIAVAAKEAN